MRARYSKATGNSQRAAETRTANYLRRLGYRLTPQRLMVLSSLGASASHVSADEIHTQVCQRYSHMPISTVYRVLELLEELNLVSRTDLGDGRVRYHLIGDRRHHHLVCKGCGTIIEMDTSLLAPLEAALRERYGFWASINHFAIFGRCQHCQGTGLPISIPKEA